MSKQIYTLHGTLLIPLVLPHVKNPLVIIQARLSSTRLPGKVLLPFSSGKTILDIQLDTIANALPAHTCVVATTTNSADDALVNHCRQRGVEVFRGSEHDVLDRFIRCAAKYEAMELVRVCSDNPFLSGEFLSEIANGTGADYMSYKNADDVPAIKTHWGLFAEYVTTAALKRAAAATDEAFYHEHVTNYIYGNEKQFAISLLAAPTVVYRRNDLRFTIDTPADFETARAIYDAWDKQNLLSLVELVDTNPVWLENMKFGIAQFTK